MRCIFIPAGLFLLSMTTMAGSPAQQTRPADWTAEGVWKTIDDKSKKVRSHVRIEKSDGMLVGKIVHLVDPKDPEPTCDKCSGSKKDQPIVGLEIMWGLARSEDENPTWTGGKVMDPENGKTYDCKIWLKDENILMVRGSIFMFGRTQAWYRLSSKPD